MTIQQGPTLDEVESQNILRCFLISLKNREKACQEAWGSWYDDSGHKVDAACAAGMLLVVVRRQELVRPLHAIKQSRSA